MHISFTGARSLIGKFIVIIIIIIIIIRAAVETSWPCVL